MNALQQQQLEAELAANLKSAQVEWSHEAREDILKRVERRKLTVEELNDANRALEEDLLLALAETRKDIAAGRFTIESPASHVARIKSANEQGDKL